MKKVFLPVLPIVFIVLIAVFFLFKGGTHAEAPSEKALPLDPSLYPELVTIDSLHHRAYIASHTSVNTVPMPITVVDTLHDTITGVIPSTTIRALAVNGTTHRLYVGDSITNSLTVFDTDTNTQIGTMSSFIAPPIALAINEITNTIYVISNTNTAAVQTGMLTVINGETGSVIASEIPIGSNPVSLAVNPLTNKIYVITSSGLNIIDGISNTVIKSLPITQNLVDIALDTVLNKMYITSKAGDAVFVVDGNVADTITTQIPITNSIDCAHTLGVDSSAHKLYAACFNGLSVIDTKTDAIIQQTPLTGELPVTHAITSQYMGMDVVLNKIYIPLEETHQIAVVGVSDPAKIEQINPVSGNEGSKVAIPFSFTDHNASSWTIAVDYGDGTSLETHSITNTSGTLQHIFTDNGTYTVTITVTSARGATSSLTTTANIQNISPTVGFLTALNNVVNTNIPVTLQAPFTDPGSRDSHTARWDWGDGTTSAGLITGSNISGIASGTHSYTKAGVYTVSVIVTDKDSAATTNKFQYIAVIDNSTQSILGAGVIDSPKGAYKANPTLTGKMNIGFFAKNTIGMTNATGSAQYNFQLGSLDFHSTIITSLVINDSHAWIKGTGQINNAGNYGFALTAQSNAVQKLPDTVLIKIWDITTGNIIYDSQVNDADTTPPSAVLQNGSIVINK